MLSAEIKRVFNENFQVYGVRKVWRQLLREGVAPIRTRIARGRQICRLAGKTCVGGSRETKSAATVEIWRPRLELWPPPALPAN
jgi:hypothetical protein